MNAPKTRPPSTMVGYAIDGTETRRQIIGGALWDVREHAPRATVDDVGDAIEHYLTHWEAQRGGDTTVPRDLTAHTVGGLTWWTYSP